MKDSIKLKMVKMIVEADDLADEEKISEILEILWNAETREKNKSSKKSTLWDRLTE